MDASDRVPMAWPCGPLEIERARRREGFTAREAEALTGWCDPRTLELLAESPVNCLVVAWAAGSAQDEDQQRALVPLVAAAGGRGLSVIGQVAAEADVGRAAVAARAAGLSAIATESAEIVTDIEVLRFRERGLDDRSRTSFLGVAGLLWPGLRASERDGVDATTGPTGPPWLDSNAWYVRLARALVDPKALWLSFDPPEIGQPVSASAYVQAIADTRVFGARWLVSLDPHLRLGLVERRAAALETWAGIGRGLAFFETHRAWTGFLAAGQLGVISDFKGAHEFLSFETLNLLARQGSLYRILEKHRAPADSFEGLDAILYLDPTPAPAELARRLYAFAEAGGTLVTPPGWEQRGQRQDLPGIPRYRVFRHGRGRLAVARAELVDPYLLAEDAQLLMSHRHDRLRVFNPGVGQRHYAVSADGRSAVLHSLLFQAPNPRLPMTVWFRQPWARARAFSVDQPEAVPVERSAVEDGVELRVPPLPVYCALELLG